MKTDSELIQEAIQILSDLRENAAFYYSAIEIDIYKSPFDGECFGARIESLLNEYENKTK